MAQNISLGTLLDKQFPPGQHIIGGGLLNRGSLLIIGGAPKTYKSIVTNSMTCQLATAEPLFGATRAVRDAERLPVFPIDKGYKILYFEQEVGEYDLKERFTQRLSILTKQHELLCRERIFICSCNHEWQLDKDDGWNLIAGEIADVAPDVVIFDPFTEFHTADENSAAEMTKVMRRLDTLREGFNLTTILIHHTGKPADGRKGADRLRGSSVFYAKADSVMVLDSTLKEGMVKVEFKLRRGRPLDNCYLQVDTKTLGVTFSRWEKDTSSPKKVVQFGKK